MHECWIMSHLNSRERWDLLREAVTSVTSKQTLVPKKVRIAFSCSEDVTTREEVERRLTMTNIKSLIPLRFYYSEEQKTQFEHLKNILDNTKINPETIIFFMDDDDKSHPQRFELLMQDFQNNPEYGWVSSDFSVPLKEEEPLFDESLNWESVNANLRKKKALDKYRIWRADQNHNEFGTLGVRRKHISQYFDQKGETVKSTFEDMWFGEWLELTTKGARHRKSLYLYRQYWPHKQISIWDGSEFHNRYTIYKMREHQGFIDVQESEGHDNIVLHLRQEQGWLSEYE